MIRTRVAVGVALAGGWLLLPTGGVGAAPQELGDQFGGYDLLARATGVQLTYDIPGVLPIKPIFQATVPETLARAASGPSSHALASLAWPGAVLADLGPVITQAGGSEAPIPPYPVRAEADFPAGPEEARQDAAEASMAVVAASEYAEAHAVWSQPGTPPGAAVIGSAEGRSVTGLEPGVAVSRALAVASDIEVAGGLLRIGSVRSELEARADGRAATTAGTTVVSDATVLGQPVVIDGDGVHPDPASPSAAALDLLASQVAGPGADVNALLGAAGLTVRIADPIEGGAGTTAERTAPGLLIEQRYDGATTPVLGALLTATGPLLPGQNLPGVPLPSSPQAVVLLLTETHVSSLAIASATVAAQATPPFALPPRPTPTTLVTPPPPTSPPLAASPPAAVPTRPAPVAAAVAAPVAVVAAPAARSLPLPRRATGLGGLVLLVAGAAPLWGLGTRKLADNVLHEQTRSCPTGKDRP